MVNLATMVAGVCFGTYLGEKIMKHELKKEITSYILNEIPHLMESEEFKQKVRELTRVATRELGIIKEELGLKK